LVPLLQPPLSLPTVRQSMPDMRRVMPKDTTESKLPDSPSLPKRTA
jgi:hypothetical protein